MANPDTIVWDAIRSSYWDGVLRDLVEEHAERTGSRRARKMLANWSDAVTAFRQVVPKEMLTRLTHPLDEADAASVAAE